MTQEEKQLLLIGLCARLPYGVICNCVDTNFSDSVDWTLYAINLQDGTIGATNGEWNDTFAVENIKPYLRPMSSMTEEEKRQYRSLSDEIDVKYGPCDFTFNLHHIRLGIKPENPHECIDECIDIEAIDWLNSHHFDYRGLIEKGLALEAPKDMYNIKIQSYE